MGGGGGGAANQTNTIRHAGYIEAHHNMLTHAAQAYRNSLKDSSPYAAITILDPDDGFFGASYTLTTYPSVYSIFESYITDVDFSALWSTTVDDAINNSAIGTAISTESSRINDEVNQVSLPKINAGMRDINAVMSSGFIHGKTLLETQKNRDLTRFSSTIKLKALEMGHDKWKDLVKVKFNTVDTYMKLNQLYWAVAFDYLEAKMNLEGQDALWPFTILDQERAIVGALNGAAAAKTQPKGASKGAKALSGALAGAAAGSAIMPGYGTAIGAVVGLAAGLLS